MNLLIISSIHLCLIRKFGIYFLGRRFKKKLRKLSLLIKIMLIFNATIQKTTPIQSNSTQNQKTVPHYQQNNKSNY